MLLEELAPYVGVAAEALGDAVDEGAGAEALLGRLVGTTVGLDGKGERAAQLERFDRRRTGVVEQLSRARDVTVDRSLQREPRRDPNRKHTRQVQRAET